MTNTLFVEYLMRYGQSDYISSLYFHGKVSRDYQSKDDLVKLPQNLLLSLCIETLVVSRIDVFGHLDVPTVVAASCGIFSKVSSQVADNQSP